jgi:SAM-dependent methyltransferase
MSQAIEEGRLWGLRSHDWARLGEPTTSALWFALLDAMQLESGQSLLDLGCGAGGAAVEASQRGLKVTGLDASGPLLEIARERLPEARFEQGDIQDLPFEDASFDGVLACNSIQFADDQRAVVREVRRVLRQGGKFGIGMWCEPERCQLGQVVGELVSRMPPPPPGSPPTLSLRENLLTLVASGGFEVVAEGEVECIFAWRSSDEAWRGMSSAGVVGMAIEKLGEDTVKTGIMNGLRNFTRPDGSVSFSNWFRFLVCV